MKKSQKLKKLNKKKSNSDEEEECSENLDLYENDGFVIDDDVESEDIPTSRLNYRVKIFYFFKNNLKSLENKDRPDAQLDSSLCSSDNEILNENLKNKKKSKLKKKKIPIDDEILADSTNNKKRFLQNQDKDFIVNSEREINSANIDDEDNQNFMKSTNPFKNKSLAHKIFQRNRKEDEDLIMSNEDQKNKINNLANTDELQDEFITIKDQNIRVTDAPERILLKYCEKDLQLFKENIHKETDWIFTNLKGKIDIKTENTYEIDITLKKKITKILELYKSDFNDIPYIITYKRSDYEPELNANMVWRIFELDQEWENLFEMKIQTNKTFNSIKIFSLEESISDNISIRFIENAQTKSDLIDMDIYNSFLKEISYDEFKCSEEETNKLIRPIKSNMIQNIKKYKIDLYSKKFSLRAYELSSNIENLESGNIKNFIKPPTPEIQPENLAREFINTIYDQEIKVMSAACKYLALEYFSFPYIRNIARYLYKFDCSISTEPTEEGKTELNPFHTSFRVKRIQRKPIDSFSDDLFMDILENEKKNMINIFIHYNENFFKDFTEKLNLPLNGELDNLESDKNSWRVMREETLRILVADYCIPYFEKEVRMELQEKAEESILRQCAGEFGKLLKTGPYKKNREISNSELFYEEEFPKVISFVYDNSKNIIYGVLLNQNGEIVDNFEFNTLLTKPSNFLKLVEKEEKNLEEVKLRNIIIQHKPDLVVIGANDLKCKIFKEQLFSIGEELNKENHKLWITFGDITIPKLAALCPKIEKQLPTYNFFQKTAISLGRIKQNPIAEITQLWHEEISKNFCLSIPLHPLIKTINQNKLYTYLELEALKIINHIGIEINKASDYLHLRSPLQFISGLGPRKANYLINKIYAIGGLKLRVLLINQPAILGEKVFNNCAGFLKVKKSSASSEDDVYYDILDITRIHPNNYPFAKKISKSAMDDTFNKTTDIAVRTVIQDPARLNCLDLQDYIKKTSEKGVKQIGTDIFFITAELTKPFKESIIEPHKDLTASELFLLLIGDQHFRKGTYILAKVIKVDNQHIKCKLPNDLDATLWVKDVYDDENITENRLKEMQEKFKEISFIETRVKNYNENTFKVDLISKEDALVNIKNYIEIDKLDKNFKIVEEDYIIKSFIFNKRNNNNPNLSKYQPRAIKHTHFQNLTYLKTIEFLRNKEIGDFVYRPSSKGCNYLTLSWKFNHNSYSHIEIEEIEKTAGNSLGSKLRVENEIYTCLNEITEKYIRPCEILVISALKNRKFMGFDSVEEMEKKLKDDKIRDKNFIQYNFTIIPEYPQYIIIGYCAKVGQFMKEYIKIKPIGLFFHNEFFENLDELSNWFKKNYGTDSYRDYVKRIKPPVFKEYKKNEEFDVKSAYYNSMQIDSIDISNSFNYENNNSCMEKNTKFDNSSYGNVNTSNNSNNFLNKKRERVNNDGNIYNNNSTYMNNSESQGNGGGNNHNNNSSWGNNENKNIDVSENSGWGNTNKSSINVNESGWGSSNNNSMACENSSNNDWKISSSNNESGYSFGNSGGYNADRGRGRGGRGRGDYRNNDSGRNNYNNDDFKNPRDYNKSNNNFGNKSNNEENNNSSWGSKENNNSINVNTDINISTTEGGWGNFSDSNTNTSKILDNPEQQNNNKSSWGNSNQNTNQTESAIENSSWGDSNTYKNIITSTDKKNINDTQATFGWGGVNSDNTKNESIQESSIWGCDKNNDINLNNSNANDWGTSSNTNNDNNNSSSGWNSDNNSCMSFGNKIFSGSDNYRGRGRGGARGGGSGGSERKCFKCQQDGHFANNCPNPSNNSERKPKICYKCQQEGHFANECPNSGNNNNSGGEGFKRPSRACFNCQEEGHQINDCPKPRERKPLVCFNCNEPGHRIGDCPKPRERKPLVCFNCNEPGHRIGDCPKPRENKPFRSGGERGGYRDRGGRSGYDNNSGENNNRTNFSWNSNNEGNNNSENKTGGWNSTNDSGSNDKGNEKNNSSGWGSSEETGNKDTNQSEWGSVANESVINNNSSWGGNNENNGNVDNNKSTGGGW